ncbi:MAG: hypothetical protein ABWZ25_11475 [Chitinophagaceae bacterium]
MEDIKRYEYKLLLQFLLDCKEDLEIAVSEQKVSADLESYVNIVCEIWAQRVFKRIMNSPIEVRHLPPERVDRLYGQLALIFDQQMVKFRDEMLKGK